MTCGGRRGNSTIVLPVGPSEGAGPTPPAVELWNDTAIVYPPGVGTLGQLAPPREDSLTRWVYMGRATRAVTIEDVWWEVAVPDPDAFVQTWVATASAIPSVHSASYTVTPRVSFFSSPPIVAGVHTPAMNYVLTPGDHWWVGLQAFLNTVLELRTYQAWINALSPALSASRYTSAGANTIGVPESITPDGATQEQWLVAAGVIT